MKPNNPSFILYFTICILIIFFKIIQSDTIVLYLKAVLVPIVFIYYLITNNYRINSSKSFIFLFCFAGDLFLLLNLLDSVIGGLLCFLIVYCLLLKLSFDNFRKLDFNKKDRLPLLVLMIFVGAICFTIMSLKFEQINPDFYLFLIYAIVLSLLCFVSFSNYIKKGIPVFFNLGVMCLCLAVSDIFFIVDNFYYDLYAFEFVNVFAKIFSYYFMVTYFIENDKNFQKSIEV